MACVTSIGHARGACAVGVAATSGDAVRLFEGRESNLPLALRDSPAVCAFSAPQQPAQLEFDGGEDGVGHHFVLNSAHVRGK
jgi:hypothetical protein